MSLKERVGHSVCPGTILSVLSIFLYCGGFIRVEVQLSGVEQRLKSVEDTLAEANGKQTTSPDDSNPTSELLRDSDALARSARSVKVPDQLSNNTPAVVRQEIIQKVDVLLKMFQSRGKVCVRGPPGNPGPRGEKGKQGKRGQKGRKGPKGPTGIMGPPGRSGKQGVMGPLGMKGEKGEKGNAGPQGPLGPKGDPGESISLPRVVVSPTTMTVNESNSAQFVCSVSGNPRSQIRWTKVGSSLPSNRTIVTGSQLQIKNVGLDDSGVYKCSARNILGAAENTVTLFVQARPRLILDIGPTYVEKGTNVTLPKCHVTGYPSPKLHWTKGGANLPTNSFVKDGQLVIVNTRENNLGQYRCEASNILGSSLAPTLLIVVSPPRFALRPPEVLNILVGSTISANCTAVGDGSPVVTWSRENGQLPMERLRLLPNNTLTIQNVKVADSGRYVCTAATRGALKTPQAIMRLNVYRDNSILYNSKILKGHPDYAKKLDEYLSPVHVNGKEWKICFRASELQFSSNSFHTHCDRKGPTVVLIRVGIYVFGGYTDKDWDGSTNSYTHSNAAFLFSLRNHLNHSYKMLLYQNHGRAIRNNNGYGPTFGGGHDIHISNNCHTNTNSYSNLGHAYRPPNGYGYTSSQAKQLFAGSNHFRCDEYEVFYQA